MKKYIDYIIFLSIVGMITLACEKELSLEIPDYKQQVVVEGHIEQGEKASVLLSLTAPYFNEYDSVSMLEYRLTTAKVVLKYDTIYEVLRLRRNNNYFPPFIYESVSRGIIDQHYEIEVISRGDTIKGETTIPEPTPIDSLWFVQKEHTDSSYYFNIRFTDDPDTKDYYVLFSMVKEEEDRFYPVRTAAYNDAFFNGKQVTFKMERGMASVLDVEEMNNYRLGNEVYVKLCTVNQAVYEYWNSYQNILVASANPFSSPSTILKSNINNGIGIFGGYGAYIDTLKIKKGD